MLYQLSYCGKVCFGTVSGRWMSVLLRCKDSNYLWISRNIGAKNSSFVFASILRWHIQEGHSAIPGATYHPYITENIDIFDFELTLAEMDEIRGLDKEKRFFNMDFKQTEQFILNWKLDD